ncbi:MAG: hypothetical protein Kow0029_18310 [Candidatus Rifleibacteriota bacterium]
MDRKRFWLTFILLLFVTTFSNAANAQPGPIMDNDEPDGPMLMNDDGPGRPEMMGMNGPEGMPPRRIKKGPKQRNPEMEKEMKQQNALRAIAEAHKELSRIYESQGKIDEAAAELKKILELFQNSANLKPKGPKAGMMTRKIIPVYHEIARLYLKNNRDEDAEKIMLEGITKFENEDPHAASKLILELSEIYRKNNKLDKAEEMLKKVIEINSKALTEK